MLISHKYKFIFIKTKKTAGTSIEVALSKLMGNLDVVTPLKPQEKEHIPRNYFFKDIKFYNHMSISKVQQIIPKNMFYNYFKFCVEREPVDKCISHFSALKNRPRHNTQTNNLSWENYLKLGFFPIDTNKYTDNEGGLLVDKIIHYENLDNELSKLGLQLGFSFETLKENAKSGFRENIEIKHEHKKIIYKAFESSNKFTNYKKAESL